MTEVRILERDQAAGVEDLSFVLVGDAHDIHCMTPDLIDTWWSSLSNLEKAEIYAASLEETPERYDKLMRTAMLRGGLGEVIDFIDRRDAVDAAEGAR
jgi:hypothetical protein